MDIAQKTLTDTLRKQVLDRCALAFLPMAEQLLLIHLHQQESDNLQKQPIPKIFS